MRNKHVLAQACSGERYHALSYILVQPVLLLEMDWMHGLNEKRKVSGIERGLRDLSQKSLWRRVTQQLSRELTASPRQSIEKLLNNIRKRFDALSVVKSEGFLWHRAGGNITHKKTATVKRNPILPPPPKAHSCTPAVINFIAGLF